MGEKPAARSASRALRNSRPSSGLKRWVAAKKRIPFGIAHDDSGVPLRADLDDVGVRHLLSALIPSPGN